MAWKCFIDKFRGKCARYWPKKYILKSVFGLIFSWTPLAWNDATKKKKKILKKMPFYVEIAQEKTNVGTSFKTAEIKKF